MKIQFNPSGKGPWGFFDPAGSYQPSLGWQEQSAFKGQSYLFQLVGIAIFVLIVGSLFVFKKYYAKTANWKWFRISIGIYQIATYFICYAIWATYLAVVLKENWFWGPSGMSRVRPLSEIMPLHLCSIHQLLSGFLLIFPSKRFFEICAPSALILPVLAIVNPVNAYWSLDNVFYYNYFILHTIIIFSYIYVYKYSLVGRSYTGLLLKWQFLWLFLFSIVAVIWDGIFSANMLYVGPNGGSPWNVGGFNIGKWNTNYAGVKYVWPLAWFWMVMLGILLILPAHVLIFFIKQNGQYDKKTKKIVYNPKSQQNDFYGQMGKDYIFFTFKSFFWSKTKLRAEIIKAKLANYFDNDIKQLLKLK
ncbi:TMEM164 family acyltransferase [Spiroplasma chrysopicola]|uniref:Transmembrane protein n=1 Tax=Spiroplasma chrysopicola DF-1 TaxID=1276227 RepID=R4U4F3_9MOLU|nr:YwaF family protein [Spiroplasma chrysopicola]AGM25448.1 hypothetical protein SCHRY_v1c08750 [Spiroplasma chrysopicola DF-1]